MIGFGSVLVDIGTNFLSIKVVQRLKLQRAF
jgi:hypothetical protein